MIVTRQRFILGLYMAMNRDIGRQLPEKAEEAEMLKLAYEILTDKLKHILERSKNEQTV